MEIGTPEWHLKGRCPCRVCLGQGQLLFVICPKCRKILLICTEVGTIFPNPHDLNDAPHHTQFDDPCDYCPRCNNVSISDFAAAKWEQIQAEGFKSGEYE